MSGPSNYYLIANANYTSSRTCNTNTAFALANRMQGGLLTTTFYPQSPRIHSVHNEWDEYCFDVLSQAFMCVLFVACHLLAMLALTSAILKLALTHHAFYPALHSYSTALHPFCRYQFSKPEQAYYSSVSINTTHTYELQQLVNEAQNHLPITPNMIQVSDIVKPFEFSLASNSVYLAWAVNVGKLTLLTAHFFLLYALCASGCSV